MFYGTFEERIASILEVWALAPLSIWGQRRAIRLIKDLEDERQRLLGISHAIDK